MMAAQSQQLVEELEGASREFESGYRTRAALLKFAIPLAALAFVGVRARGPTRAGRDRHDVRQVT